MSLSHFLQFVKIPTTGCDYFRAQHILSQVISAINAEQSFFITAENGTKRVQNNATEFFLK